MASAALPNTDESTVCGYCWDEVGRLTQPKKLPCGHVFCTPCLTKHLETAKVLTCGQCRASYDIPLDDLPSVDTPSTICQPCSHKGLTNNAVVHCKECNKQFCEQHRQSHSEMLFEHTANVVDINVYQKQAKKLETKFCSIHKTQPRSWACFACHRVMCIDCFDGIATCSAGGGGTAHQPVSLNSVFTKLKRELEKLKGKVQEKEEKLSSLSKQCSQVIGQLDEETQDLVKTIHKTRDVQIRAINVKYAELETELLREREKSRQAVESFMESDVGGQWNAVIAEIQRTTAQIRDNHQVDFVDSFKGTEKLLSDLVNVELPSLAVTELMGLQAAGLSRDAEFKLVPSGGRLLIPNKSAVCGAPTSLQLIREMKTDYLSLEMITGDGKVWFFQRTNFTESGFSIVEPPRYVQKRIGSIRQRLRSADRHRDRFYTLHDDNPWKVCVISTEGTEITSWDHPEVSHLRTQIAVVADQLIVPNKSRKQLTVYSLDGRVIRQIPLPDLMEASVYVCSAGADSVIVSIHKASLILRVNVNSGEVMWRSTAVTQPQGVASYGDQTVLLSDGESISALDMRTGVFTGRLSCDGDLNVGTNICVLGDQLLTFFGFPSSTLYFYKLI